MRLRRRVVASGLTLLVALSGCVEHPVGPARTDDAYRGKAVTTAESALSAVQTVALLADSAANGRVFGPYAGVVASEQEDGLVGLQATFGSIQPPGQSSDELRTELLGILAQASDHVTSVRLAVRRGELDGLDQWLVPLGTDRDALRAFVADHG